MKELYVVVTFNGNGMIDVSIAKAYSASEAFVKTQTGEVEYNEDIILDGFYGIGGFARKIDEEKCPIIHNPKQLVEWCFNTYVEPIIPLLFEGAGQYANV